MNKDYTENSEEEILEWLRANLDEERFEHSLATAECAVELAEKFGENSQKAYVAGLLHDCAKCFDIKKLEKIIDKYVDIDRSELLNPKTYHAPSSAYIAQQQFGVYDEEILSSIFNHTIGKLNMNDFEKIIFLADKIEPKTRNYDYCANVRAVLDEENGLDKALFICYSETIKSLVERKLAICPTTIDIYNKLLEKI